MENGEAEGFGEFRCAACIILYIMYSHTNARCDVDQQHGRAAPKNGHVVGSSGSCLHSQSGVKTE